MMVFGGPDQGVRRDAFAGRRPLSTEQFLRVAALAGGLVVVLILAVQALRPVYAVRPMADAPEPEFKAYLDRAVPLILHHFGVPGMVISTVVGGAPDRTYAYGLADRERGTPMRADTVFRVASISKSLTAWGVLRLARTGKVDLDAPARRYLDRWPLPKSDFDVSGVTLRRLLDHTAGLNAGADQFRDPKDPALSTLGLLSREGDGPAPGPAVLISRPGETFRYSVPGYTLLRLVIEERTHQPFQAFMKSQVLGPLGMTSSSFDWDQALRGRTATPYDAGQRAIAIVVPQDLAADSLFATAPDLARYVAAPLPVNPLSAVPEKPTGLAGRISAGADHLPRIELEGLKFDGPGLGCFIERLGDGRMAVTNGGYDPGWSSQFYLVPSTGDGIVVLTNSDIGEPAIAEVLADWAAWRGLPATKMTRAHYILRLDVALALGILVMISLYLGADVIIEVGAGARRLGGVGVGALGASLIEAVLAFALMGLWILVRGPIGMAMPTFYGFGTFAISLFAFVALARLVFPIHRDVGRHGRLAPLPVASAVMLR